MNTFNKKLLLKTVAIVILQGFVLSNIATFSQYSLFASATNKQIRQGWLRKGWKEVLVSGEGQKQADGIRSNKEIPEYIYMVMPKTYYPLVTTAPSSKNHIPEQFSTTPDSATDEDIVLVYRNNGFITKKMAFSMEAAGEIAAELGLEEDKIIGLWMDINFGNISKYSAALSKAGIDDIYRYAGEKLEYNLDLERP